MEVNTIVQIALGIITLIGIIITGMFNRSKTVAEFKAQQEVFNVRLQEQMNARDMLTNAKLTDLTAEVREHNNFAKRMPVVESQMAEFDRRLTRLENEKKVS